MVNGAWMLDGATKDRVYALSLASRGIRIDYAASKDETRSKDELSQELATNSKIPSMGLGSFSQRVTQGTILVVRKMGVAIVSVSKWN
ncbi:hypothetical protein PIB30_030353 [Stylosanthes scabra]|uniref:Uncharacterized protein n=1 Tax=Stylosanthes scabra TaxID=79078 RepID=A0ABU6VCD2_9FABA|nr:hypothetical protein [Stylosanthes scabra]